MADASSLSESSPHDESPPAKKAARTDDDLEATTSTTKKKKTSSVTLPPTLESALLKDVVLKWAQNKDGSFLTKDGDYVKTAESINGVKFAELRVDQLRMICANWGLKKYRGANRMDIGQLIAQHQLVGYALSKAEDAFNDKKTLLQASKFRLLNVLFSEDYISEVVIMNHTKHKDELDKRKSGRNERLWSSISEAYNDTENDDEFGEFAFIDDEQIGEFVSMFDLSKYMQLDWVKATHWFKEMVSDYDAAMILFTKSGNHSPDFYGYCKSKPATYYYRLDILSKPNSHKSFGVVLSEEIFSSSDDNANSTSTAAPRLGANSMKKKEEAMSRIALSMTQTMVANQNRSSKRQEKMQLERDTGAFFMNITTLPAGATGDVARKFMNDQINTNSERIDDITQWFTDNPSPSK
jgi:hypothetical protein